MEERQGEKIVPSFFPSVSVLFNLSLSRNSALPFGPIGRHEVTSYDKVPLVTPGWPS